ncbi:MAG TPA: carbohydrate ABC transporter permease, partial [Micromonosporaceae bacterium]
MSTAATTQVTTLPTLAEAPKRAEVAKKRLTSPWASLTAVVLALLWTVPTFGLLITSFRPQREILRTGWWTFFSNPNLTLDNYKSVLQTQGNSALGNYFVNSFIIVIPSVVIPIVLASLAAYAFAWLKFPGRDLLFVGIFALQIVPIQVTLIPLLTMFVKAHLGGTFWALWLAHSTFALPLAIFLLHNFMK